MNHHLRSLGNRIVTKISPDEKGFIGRECPNCNSYFKIVPGTGLKGEEMPCHCPYCGHKAEHNQFLTEDQIEYARSVVMRKVSEALRKDLKALEFTHKTKGIFGVKISAKVKKGRSIPIRCYQERLLETEIACTNCTLRYSVYGVFAFCPDCARHNSLDILNRNLDIVRKMLDLARKQDQRELSEKLIENALEDCISVFDGFGREICRVHGAYTQGSVDASRIRFQNIRESRKQMKTAFEIDIAGSLSEEDWNQAVILFQKRHVVAHRMGVIDQEYVSRTDDKRAILGRKIVIDTSEIEKLVEIIGVISEHISAQFRNISASRDASDQVGFDVLD